MDTQTLYIIYSILILGALSGAANFILQYHWFLQTHKKEGDK